MGLWQHSSTSLMMRAGKLPLEGTAMIQCLKLNSSLQGKTERPAQKVTFVESIGVNSLLRNGNSQSSGLVIGRSAKSSGCSKGGAASQEICEVFWVFPGRCSFTEPRCTRRMQSCISCSAERLRWESIVEYKSFTAVLNYALYCSTRKKLLQFYYFPPPFPVFLG